MNIYPINACDKYLMGFLFEHNFNNINRNQPPSNSWNSHRWISARQQAEADIRKELARQKKTFIQFRQELNRPMCKLVRQHLVEQKKVYINTYMP